MSKTPESFWIGLGSFWDGFENRREIEYYWEGLLETFTESSRYLYQQYLSRFSEFSPDIWDHKYLSFPIVWSGEQSTDINETAFFDIEDQYKGIFSIPVLSGVETNQVLIENIDFKVVDLNKINFFNGYPESDSRYGDGSGYKGVTLHAPISYRIDPVTHRLNRKLAEIESLDVDDTKYWPFTFNVDATSTSFLADTHADTDVVTIAGSDYEVRTGPNHAIYTVDDMFSLDGGNSPASTAMVDVDGAVTFNFGGISSGTFEINLAKYTGVTEDNHIGIKATEGSDNIIILDSIGANGSYTFSEVISSTKDYAVRILRIGDVLDFYINDEKVAGTTSSSYTVLNKLHLVYDVNDVNGKTCVLKNFEGSFQISSVLTQEYASTNLGTLNSTTDINFYYIGSYTTYSNISSNQTKDSYEVIDYSALHFLLGELVDYYKYRVEKTKLLKYMSWGVANLKSKSPTITNMKNIYGMLYNLPFAYESGTAVISGQEMTVGSFNYWLPAGESWPAGLDGASIEKFDPLTSGIEMQDRVTNPTEVLAEFGIYKQNSAFILNVELSSKSDYIDTFLDVFNTTHLGKGYNYKVNIT